MIIDFKDFIKIIEENEKIFFKCVCCGIDKNENYRSHLYYWKGKERKKITNICEECRELLHCGRFNLEDYEIEQFFEAVKFGEISDKEDFEKFIKKLRSN